MRYAALFSTIIFLIFSFLSPASAQSSPTQQQSEQRIEGVVSDIKEEKKLTDGGVDRKYQKLELVVTSNEKKGQKIIVENGKVPIINSVEYKTGDKVSVSITKAPDGKDAYFITDYVRRSSLYLLVGIFFALTIIVGRLRGVTSLIGMALSFAMIFFVVLPQILKGHDPITVVILSSLVIIPISFYLTHGVSKKTTSAVLGTLISLIITGALADFFVNSGHLSGYTSDEATFLETAKKGVVQMKGLLLAGIIIGALGVLDDITISQSAIVFKLRETSEKLRFWQVYKKAMDIGRDHIASMVNTLVLVYTGAAMPLLLIFNDNPKPFTEIINYEMIAEEIVRTIVVSIGLILAVPIVTFIATVLSDLEFKRASKEILHSLK